MAQVMFFIAGIGAIAGAIGVVTVRNPFYSVLALVFHLLSLAALFLLLRAEFVAAAQVIVYAGAVMVLYVFVVAYVGGADEPLRPHSGPGLRWAAIVFSGALFVELVIAFLGSSLKGISHPGSTHYAASFGTPSQIGAAAADEVPGSVRARIVPAADRGGRRGRARPAPRRDLRYRRR